MKRTILESVIFILIVAVGLILCFLPDIFEGTALYLFGNFIAEPISFDLLVLPVFLFEVFLHIKSFKEYTVFKKISYSLLSCCAAVLLIYSAVNTVKNFLAEEEINLPDGNKIVLYEQKSILAVPGERERGTTIKVYKVSGIIAKRIDTCFESRYCNDYCLKENKWDYTYDETNKTFTLSLSYDSPADEDDTGFWKQEFILD